MTTVDLQAAIAVTRFGLGARPGDIETAKADPQGWLLAQVGQSPGVIDLPSAQTALTQFNDYNQKQQEMKTRLAGAQAGPEDIAWRDAAIKSLNELPKAEVLARVRLGCTTAAPFAERWRLFFCNWFTVAAKGLHIDGTLGPFEREAIQPHMFGRFEDLLIASSTHPAMLIYLDQAQSIGPNSKAGDHGKRGLNENLAREILELHSLGVHGGYTQADVTEFARALTGWSIGRFNQKNETGGVYLYRPNAHEPGDRVILGKTYPAGDEAQGRAILQDLARRPATAHHLATRLAEHFVADAPPPDLIARLEQAYLAHDGGLDAVARALITAPQSWDPAFGKFKTPYDFLVSSYRSIGAQPADAGKLGILNTLGERPYSANSPKGWPDDEASWAAPDAIYKRLQYAQNFAGAATPQTDIVALADQTLGARLSPLTRKTISRAESRQEAFAILLMSPEFQRR